MRDAEKKRAYNREYQKKNQKRVRAQQRAWTYGISVEVMNVMLTKGCGICGAMENLCIDHDHETGKVRGALCSKHNVGLGQFDDNPDLLRRAIQWIEEHRK